MNSQLLIWIFWPSFIVAAVAEVIFFTFFDPGELIVFGAPLELQRTAVYSIGFFALWMTTAAACALTCLLQLSDTRAKRRAPGAAVPRERA